MHVERVDELRILACGLRAEEKVGCPPAAANEDAPPVDAKEQSALRCHLGRDLANAEAKLRTIRHALADDEFQREILKHGPSLSKLGGPPELRVRDAKLRETVRREAHLRAVMRREGDVALERDRSNAAAQDPAH